MFETVFWGVEHIWWFILAYSIAAKYIIYELLGRKTGKFRGLQSRDLTVNHGMKAIVTGGSRGIGLEIVYNLLESGYHVIIGSSANSDSRENLKQILKKKFPQSTIDVWHLDLSSLKSVSSFAKKYLSTEMPLHLLINNAGIMFVEEEITEDGFEKHFAVNYLSHCLLTLLLLPLLSKSGSKAKKSRIINCTSCIHYVGKMDLENLVKHKYYSKYRAYIESKLAQVMFTYSLQSHINAKDANVTVNCVHPGVVNTELMSKELLFPATGSFFLKTAKEGAETAIFAALSPEMEGIGGKYLEECTPTVSSKISLNKVLQKELWDKSLSLLRLWLDPLADY